MHAKVRRWRLIREYTFAEFILLASMWLCIQRSLHEDVCHVVECGFYVNYLNVYWQILCGQNECQWFLYVLWELRLEEEVEFENAYSQSLFFWSLYEFAVKDCCTRIHVMWLECEFLCDLSECVLKELCGQNERSRFLKYGHGRKILLLVCALKHFLSGCWV